MVPGGNTRDLLLDLRVSLAKRHYPPTFIDDGIKYAKKVGIKILTIENHSNTSHLKIYRIF